VAKVIHWEFKKSDELVPGQAIWVSLGSSDYYRTGALAITAIPHQGRGGEMDVLKVENINITRTQKKQGTSDIPEIGYHAGCSIKNNGKTTVYSWAVMVGVIAP
jgi:hypothetical protein